MRGIADAAGGVLSASSSNSTKNATKMFIPATAQLITLTLILNVSLYSDLSYIPRAY